MEDNKIVYRLIKKPLKSEREEIKTRRKKKFLQILLCVFLFLSGLGIGFGVTFFRKYTFYISHSSNKFDEIKDYMKNIWLYAYDYEDLDTVLEDKAFYGMTKFSDDRYTTYMSNEELNNFVSNINMNYVGIGVSYYLSGGKAIVQKVFKESPAENAGILSGDAIVGVDGVSIKDMQSDDIKEYVQGIEGTVVKITILRGDEELTLDVVRGPVNSTAYAETHDDYVLLKIDSFGVDTEKEIIKYLDNYLAYDKIIIDLRNNTGGYEKTAREVAGLFLGNDAVLMHEIYNTGDKQTIKVISNRYYSNFKKVVILTNSMTASAAEVLTICLMEEHPDATSVGETTYGKGIVLANYSLNDGSAIKLSTAYWVSPNGVSIDQVGVNPDIEVLQDDIIYMPIYEIGEEVYEYDSVSAYAQIAQMCLEFLDYDVSRTDGYFDLSTDKALKEFKKDHNLAINGLLDKETYDALISTMNIRYVSDPSKDLQMLKAIELIES